MYSMYYMHTTFTVCTCILCNMYCKLIVYYICRVYSVHVHCVHVHVHCVHVWCTTCTCTCTCMFYIHLCVLEQLLFVFLTWQHLSELYILLVKMLSTMKSSVNERCLNELLFFWKTVTLMDCYVVLWWSIKSKEALFIMKWYDSPTSNWNVLITTLANILSGTKISSSMYYVINRKLIWMVGSGEKNR